jgi:hypothetical protein
MEAECSSEISAIAHFDTVRAPKSRININNDSPLYVLYLHAICSFYSLGNLDFLLRSERVIKVVMGVECQSQTNKNIYDVPFFLSYDQEN